MFTTKVTIFLPVCGANSNLTSSPVLANNGLSISILSIPISTGRSVVAVAAV